MTSKLIKLEDGTLIEVQVPGSKMVPISGGRTVKRVKSSLAKIQPILINAIKPLTESWGEIENVDIVQDEIELGLSFEAEGNLYVTKAKAGANLIVKLIVKPK